MVRSILGRVAGLLWRSGGEATQQQRPSQQQQALRVEQTQLQQVPVAAPAPAADIPYDKAAQIRYGCDSTPCPAVDPHQLSEDLANTVVWSGGWCTDYLFYVANWHGLLGIFCCHPQHPWTKVARLIAQLVSCSFLLWVTAFRCSIDKEGEIISTVHFVVATLVTCFDVVYGLYLYQVSVMNTLCCGRCKDNSVATGATRICQCAVLSQGACFGCMIFSSALLAIVIPSFLERLFGWSSSSTCEVEQVFAVALQSRVESYLLWFPMMLFMPCCGYVWRWQNEMKEFHKRTQLAAVAASSQAAANIQPYGGYPPQQAVYMPPQQAHMPPQAYAMHQQPPGYGYGPAAGQALR